MVGDRDKFADIIDSFFGVDSAYYGVDKYQLADYLLANGLKKATSNELPCNVGDKVYALGMFTGQIIESVVTSIIYTGNNVFLHLENETVVDVVQQLGKTIFLNKEDLKAVFKDKIEIQ